MNHTSLSDISQPFVIVPNSAGEREDVAQFVLDHLKIKSGSYVSFDQFRAIQKHEDIFEAFRKKFPARNTQFGLEMAFFETFVAGFDAGRQSLCDV